MSYAKPNTKQKKLTKSEKMRITILTKYDTRITGNFITSKLHQTV